MTLFDFNVKNEFWSFLIPENLSKMTFFELNFENLPKTTYFLIRSKSPQNDNYFFGRFFQNKKNNTTNQNPYNAGKNMEVSFIFNAL